MHTVKTVKRRIVQRTVEAIGKAEHVTLGDEAEFRTAVSNFKSLETEVVALREQVKDTLAVMDRALDRNASLAGALAAYFASDAADPSGGGSTALRATAGDLAAALARAHDVAMRSVARVVQENAIKSLTAFLVRFPPVKKRLIEHANLETDVSSYTRRVKGMREKGRPDSDPELAKLLEKETRARNAYVKLHEDLHRELREMYASRHDSLRTFFVTLAAAQAELFRVVDEDLANVLKSVDRGDQQIVRDEIAALIRSGGPPDPSQSQSKGAAGLVRSALGKISLGGRSRSTSSELKAGDASKRGAGAPAAPSSYLATSPTAGAGNGGGTGAPLASFRSTSSAGSGASFSSAAAGRSAPPPPSAAPPVAPGAGAASRRASTGMQGDDAAGEEVECEVAVALFDYEGPDEGDLSFKEGETILVQEKIDEGWWRGYNSTDVSGVRGAPAERD